METKPFSLWPRLVALGFGCAALAAGIVLAVQFIDQTETPAVRTRKSACGGHSRFFADPASFRGREVTLSAFVFPVAPEPGEMLETHAAEPFEITSTPITQGKVMLYWTGPKQPRLFAHIPLQADVEPGILANDEVLVTILCKNGNAQTGNEIRAMRFVSR